MLDVAVGDDRERPHGGEDRDHRRDPEQEADARTGPRGLLGREFDDLREWLSSAERLGEVRNVRGANWQEDIGLAAEAILRADDGPCVLFEDVPGCPKGFRLLLNMFAGTRRNMTLGFPDQLSKWELSEAFREAFLKDQKIIGHEIVENGPVFENILMGDDIDVTKSFQDQIGAFKVAYLKRRPWTIPHHTI